MAVYDGCGSVAFVHCLRLSPIYGCDSLGAIWVMGMLSSCICSTLMSVCAMKGIRIGLLALWGKDLTYYLTPFFCLVNRDMYYPDSACRGMDVLPGKILYIHTDDWSMGIWIFRSDVCKSNIGGGYLTEKGTKKERKTTGLYWLKYEINTFDLKLSKYYLTKPPSIACGCA